MKKLFISALFAITVAASSFAAGGSNVSYAARNNFRINLKKFQMFNGLLVKIIQWQPLHGIM
jgi:hypothetical protein